MRKVAAVGMVAVLMLAAVPSSVWAANTAKHGTMTGKTVCTGLLSLVVWPGLGQYMNDNETKKNVTHAVLGLTVVFRFWSGWDALIDRQGGRWDGKI